MRVRVGDYLIRSDSVCFSLCELKVVQAKGEGDKGKAPNPENIGKEREVVVGYYGNLHHTLRALADKLVMRDDIDSTELLLASLDRVHGLIAKIPNIVLVKGSGMEAQEADSSEDENSPQGE